MSRLDYITIAIVAACILAIIFLVYKMTDVFSDSKPMDKVENVVDKVEEELTDEGTIDYGDLEDGEESSDGDATTDDATVAGGSDATDNNATTEGQEGYTGDTDTDDDDSGDEDDEGEVASSSTPTSFNNTPSGKSSGKYMVIAGTFKQKSNAQKQLQKLKDLGYTSASVEGFDKGTFAVLLVDRFDDKAKAQRLVSDLKAEGVSSYVKTK